MSVSVKICGVKTVQAIEACVESGAKYVGFMFVPSSPRYVSALIASELALRLPTTVKAVGVFVNPDPEFLDHILHHVPLDYIQLHGDETVSFIEEIRKKHSVKIIKAVGIETAFDFPKIDEYKAVVDMVLLDSKSDTDQRGGTGKPFNWSLLKAYKWEDTPWMLAGGVTFENVKTAVEAGGASIIDLSSALESERGEKDPERIKLFMDKVKKIV